MKKLLVGLITHGIAVVIGFAAGIYALPILTAPDAPDEAMVQAAMSEAKYHGTFSRDLKGSDFLHWGEGKIAISANQIVLDGEIAPGPDYFAYLSPEFVEDEAEFEAAKSKMVRVGSVKTFKNFILDVPSDINVGQYSTVVIWCESFGEFITAATYQP